MKKFLVVLLSICMCFSLFCGCNQNSGDGGDIPPSSGEESGGGSGEGSQTDWLSDLSSEVKTNLSADGYVRDNISDFSQYQGTDAYRTVSTVEEFATALSDAVWHYKTIWNEDSQSITQEPAEGYTQDNFKGTVHVIEITEDLDLGYNVVSERAKATGLFENGVKSKTTKVDGVPVPTYTMSSMVEEHGISKLKVQNTNDLLIYSKNGAKITHCTMNVMACSNVVFRNLEFDEVWQWEDSQFKTASKVGDYDSQGWAYFKINFCGYIWIDHCTFGKAIDGLIDYANPVYSATALMASGNRAPYGLVDERGVHVSWCDFKSGSDDKNGYIYKMMSEIEKNYQANLKDENVTCKYLYYKALRDEGCDFETILYGLAIPQKKAFLCGDSGDNNDDYKYNRKLKISFANCNFTNVEDRIPKVRGGNCYFYNNIVNNFTYYSYRTKLQSFASAVTKVNSGWKCALVSQGVLTSNGASVMVSNCIFYGVKTLIKNNDKIITVDGNAQANKGYFQFSNCLYQLTENDKSISSNNPGESTVFSTNGNALTEGFSWHATNGKLPFEIAPTSVRNLNKSLNDENYGVGVRSAMGSKCLITKYE